MITAGVDPASEQLGNFPDGAAVEVVHAQVHDQRTRLQVVLPEDAIANANGSTGWVKWKNPYGRVLLEREGKTVGGESLRQPGSESPRPVQRPLLAAIPSHDTASVDSEGSAEAVRRHGPSTIQDKIDDALVQVIHRHRKHAVPKWERPHASLASDATTDRSPSRSSFVQTCTDLRVIKAVIREADQKRYTHPSLNALRMKAESREAEVGREALSGAAPTASH